MGIVVSESEQKDMISGPNPDPTIQQYFTTIFQAQQFDPRMVQQFEQEVKAKSAEEPKLLELGQQWEALKKFVVRGKLIQKYSAMIAGSVYTPKAIVAQNNKSADMQASFRYVKLPLTLIPDAQAPVSEADLKDYMNRHKAQFEADQPTRTIDYVVFDVFPGAEDTAKSYGVLEKLKPEFVAATDNENFINRNSENRYAERYFNKTSYTGPMADTILKGAIGSVYGPFYDNGNYSMVKVIGRRDLPDSVRAQHILIGTANQQNPNGLSDTLAHQRADSIFAAIKAGANFDTLASKFSDDPGSKVKGGDLGYFSYGTMVPEFNEASFMGAKGDIKEVKSAYGWHIIKVNDQKNFQPNESLGIITKALTIGAKADQEQFAKANEFAGNNRTAAAFDAAVKKNNLSKRVGENLKPGDYVIPGLNASRDVVRWAFSAKAGEISDPIHLENKYVVAKLAEVNEPGLRGLDEATKTQVEALVRNEKISKLLSDKYKNVNNLETLAQQSGQQVQTADSISGTASFTPGLGFEPRVVGYAFNASFKPGTVSPAITGKEGVFFISLNSRNAIQKNEDPQAIQTQSHMMDMQAKNSLPQHVGEALRKQGTIKIKPDNIF